MVLAISRNTNLDITLLTHGIRYVLVVWKLNLHFIFFFLRSQNYTTLRRGVMSELKNNDFIMSLNENDLLHVVMYANENFDRSMNIIILSICDYKIYQRFWKIWPNSFSTIIKTTLVPPSIHFLNFLFKNSVVLQLEFSSWYVFAFVLFCFIYLPLLILIFIYLF